MKLFTILLGVVASATGATAFEVPNLDPETYKEPSQALYFVRNPEALAPGSVPRMKAADLTREDFDRRIQDGEVFIVEDFGKEWPMEKWDCEFFRSDPVFKGARMSVSYDENAGADGKPPSLGSDWLAKKVKSGAADEDAPQQSPFYWGIKDILYEDTNPNLLGSWKKEMLTKVQKHIKLPAFMDPSNLDGFKRTPEFWFSSAGSGAKAHMDTHIQTTISIQLAGEKRWRLGFMGERRAPYLEMIYTDGRAYKGGHTGLPGDKWNPEFTLSLKQGEALFMPPGFIHETRNEAQAGKDGCGASVTFQFDHPMASRMFRNFLPRVRRTADIHEIWNPVAAWAWLGGPTPKPEANRKFYKKGHPYAEAKKQVLEKTGPAGKRFASLDKDKDGVLTHGELKDVATEDGARDMIGFHDLNRDGQISLAEYAEVFAFWAATEKKVMDDTPEKLRKFQIKDMDDSGFNIEDLPSKVQLQARNHAMKLEAERREKKSEL
eukprot:TRINITY_DN13045_c0_g1_i3.p1 TRINITY_DN13045_c0_g1~~TRINITY_DN13045_c0_g1_i3.p1  ORF type:complete len:491 (+),score=99.32 TRINITY_DN13045_c0_g1_i3:106-1578(+)